MTKNKICRVCQIELNNENWYSTHQRNQNNICKKCDAEKGRLWAKANPEKKRAQDAKKQLIYRRKRGSRPMGENKECSSFLGVHIAERVLSRVFNDVVRLPYGHKGFDIVCNNGKAIDVKSSCLRKSGDWAFGINRNTIADYFLCLAFDNRIDLTPLHAWLIPGRVINHLTNTGISPSTLGRWDAYILDISKIYACCDSMRGKVK